MPFDLRGKHRDRREFKHPGEAAASKEQSSESHDFPDGVFLAQKDRKDVLDMMKGQWEDINKEYQKLTLSLHNLHTIERVKRRQELENQLATLEKSIKTMERPFVFLQVELCSVLRIQRGVSCESGSSVAHYHHAPHHTAASERDAAAG